MQTCCSNFSPFYVNMIRLNLGESFYFVYLEYGQWNTRIFGAVKSYVEMNIEEVIEDKSILLNSMG